MEERGYSVQLAQEVSSHLQSFATRGIPSNDVLRMTSALSSQLKGIKQSRSIARSFNTKKKTCATFYFTAKEATLIDDETIYNLACNGLLELENQDTRFRTFQQTLFAKSKLQFHRAHCTKEDLENIDQLIQQFLTLLSPYFLLKSAHKTLEFLIRKYEIQQWNIDAIMQCILCYHESKPFAKMVQLLQLHQKSRWGFLSGVHESGEPLLRSALARRCIQDGSLISFIGDMVQSSGSTNPKLVSFHTLVMVEIIESVPKVTEKIMRSVLPQVVEGIKAADYPDRQASAYMIVTKIAAKAALSEAMRSNLMALIAKNTAAGLGTEALLCIVFLIQSQNIEELAPVAFKHICQIQNLPYVLVDLVETYDIKQFLSLFLSFGVEQLAQEENTEYLEEVLVEIITAVPVTFCVVDVVAKLLSHVANLDQDKDKELLAVVGRLLKQIGTQYPTEVDRGLEVALKDHEDSDKDMLSFVSSTFGDNSDTLRFLPMEASGTTLFLSLEHPNSQIRLMALDRIVELCNSGNKDCHFNDVDALLRRITDDSEEVVLKVLCRTLGQLLVQLAPVDLLFDTVAAALKKWSNKALTTGSANVIMALIKYLCLTVAAANKGQFDTKLQNLLVRFFPSTECTNSQIRVAAIKYASVIQSPFCATLKNLNVEGSQDLSSKIIAKFGAVLAEDVDTLLPVCTEWIDDDAIESTGFVVSVIKNAYDVVQDRENAMEECRALRSTLLRVVSEQWQAVTISVVARDITEARGLTNDLRKKAVFLSSTLCDIIAEAYADASYATIDRILVLFLSSPHALFHALQRKLQALFENTFQDCPLTCMSRLLVASNDYEFSELACSRVLHIYSAAFTGWAKSKISTLSTCVLFKEMKQLSAVLLVCAGYSARCIRQGALSTLAAIASIKLGKTSTKKGEKKMAEWLAEFQAICTGFHRYEKELLADQRCFEQYSKEIFAADDNQSMLKYFLEEAMARSEDSDGRITYLIFKMVRTVNTWSTWTKVCSWYEKQLSDDTNMSPLIRMTLQIIVRQLAQVESAKGSPAASFKSIMATYSFASTPADEAVEVQLAGISSMTGKWFEALDTKQQLKLVEVMIKTLLTAEERMNVQLHHAFRRLPICSSVFCSLLQSQVLKAKTPELQLITSFLEVLQYKIEAFSNEKDAKKEGAKLLDPLHELLQLILEREDRSDYVLQLLLDDLLQVVGLIIEQTPSDKLLTAAASLILDPSSMIANIFKCMQSSNSPQTRNSALRLISRLSDLYPQQVLDALLPVLTYMNKSDDMDTGKSMMSQNNDYSFYVITEAIHQIVPHLQNQKLQTSVNSQSFIQSFVEAYDSIPLHRRGDLFCHLVRTMGTEYIPMTLLLLLEAAAKTMDQGKQDEVVAFAQSLCHEFDAEDQILALGRLLSVASQMQVLVAEDADIGEEEDNDDNIDAIYQLDEDMDVAHARRMNVLIVKFVPAQLLSRKLHLKIVDMCEDEEDDQAQFLQEAYLRLAQTLLLYLNAAARQQNVDSDKAFWQTIAAELFEAVSVLQRLLASPSFVAVIAELLHHEDSSIRRKSLELLNDRIEESHDALSPGEELLYVDMLEDLQAALSNSSESMTNIQTALLSVEVLARNFGADHPKRFQSIVPAVISLVKQDIESTNLNVFGAAAMCLGSICQQLQDAAFPHLPKFFGLILDALEWSCSVNVNTLTTNVAVLKQCLINTIHIITQHLSKFLSPYLSRMVNALLLPGIIASDSFEVADLAQTTLATLTTSVEARQMLPALFNSYSKVLTYGDRSTVQLFSALGLHLNGFDRQLIQTYLASVVKFFITALDIRRLHMSKFSSISAVEEALISCFMEFVLKLNEKQLKPIFMKLCEWFNVHKSADEGVPRRIVFYRLLQVMTQRLKSIFVPYFGFILNECVDDLAKSRSILGNVDDSDGDEDDPFFEEQRPVKRSRVGSSVGSETGADSSHWRVLVEFLVGALNECFRYDSVDFMDEEKFNQFLTPLVDLLEVFKREDLETILVPCIANFASAAKTDTLWKPLHREIMMKSRSENVSVRIASLLAIQKCYSVVGEEFLVLLPESIPFLSELTEDDDESVVQLCQELIKQIEAVSGESLDEYLCN